MKRHKRRTSLRPNCPVHVVKARPQLVICCKSYYYNGSPVVCIIDGSPGVNSGHLIDVLLQKRQTAEWTFICMWCSLKCSIGPQIRSDDRKHLDVSYGEPHRQKIDLPHRSTWEEFWSACHLAFHQSFAVGSEKHKAASFRNWTGKPVTWLSPGRRCCSLARQ